MIGFDENVAGLALILDDWPVVEGFPRFDTTIVVDGYNVVLTHWLTPSEHPEGGVLSARVEDPTTGEILATRLFEDAYIGRGGFSLIDESGNVVVEVNGMAIAASWNGRPPDDRDVGPRWRVDTSVEPWVAVRI